MLGEQAGGAKGPRLARFATGRSGSRFDPLQQPLSKQRPYDSEHRHANPEDDEGCHFKSCLRYDSAVLKDPEFGRLLVLDSTDEFTPAGSLSAPLAGQKAVLVAGDRGRLVTLPSAQASSHRLERRLDLTVLPGRVLSARVESRFFGEFGREARSDYHQSSLDRRRNLEGRWTRLWPGAVVGDYTVETEATDGAFVEKSTISRIPLTTSGTEIGVPPFPGASWDLDRVPLGKRKSPVDYVFPRTVHYEVSLQGLPPGAALPESQRLEGNGWAVETTIRTEPPVPRAFRSRQLPGAAEILERGFDAGQRHGPICSLTPGHRLSGKERRERERHRPTP